MKPKLILATLSLSLTYTAQGSLRGTAVTCEHWQCTAVYKPQHKRATTPCEERKWHLNIESTQRPGCSNSFKVPIDWHGNDRFFFGSAEECCSHLMGDDQECNIYNACDTKQQPTDHDDHCSDNPKWHYDLDTKEGCTNSPRYPDAWNDPAVAVDMLFDTAAGCCERFVKRGIPCTTHDVCSQIEN